MTRTTFKFSLEDLEAVDSAAEGLFLALDLMKRVTGDMPHLRRAPHPELRALTRDMEALFDRFEPIMAAMSEHMEPVGGCPWLTFGNGDDMGGLSGPPKGGLGGPPKGGLGGPPKGGSNV